MKTKEGRIVVTCIMSDDARKSGPCASCRCRRTWLNCDSLKEGDPDFCDGWILCEEEVVA